MYTYECDAVETIDFDYPSVWAEDSHNGVIDVCERIFFSDAAGDYENEMCCTPDDRLSQTAGCDLVIDSFGYSDDFAPNDCASYDNAVCGGIDGSVEPALPLSAISVSDFQPHSKRLMTCWSDQKRPSVRFIDWTTSSQK